MPDKTDSLWLQVEKRRLLAMENAINRTSSEIRGMQARWTELIEATNKRMDEQDALIVTLIGRMDEGARRIGKLEKGEVKK